VGGRNRAFSYLELTRKFEKSFRKLGSDSQDQCADALEQLIEEPLAPGLHLKPIRPSNKFWEARINSGDRIVLLPNGDMAFVMDVVKHDDISHWGSK
jgi:mRNA-degrading endonuclease RelE of RelBE toxin-antitoxin system